MNKYLNSKNSLIIVLTMFVTAIALYFPKIYLSNSIYYTSKDINKLNGHHVSLKEENRFLSQQLEDMKFKNQIVDSLITEKLEEK